MTLDADNQAKFQYLREKYPDFCYHGYDFTESASEISINYHFEIPGLANFEHFLRIPRKNFRFRPLETDLARNLIFQLGLIEMLSYWKATCSPKIHISCGTLSPQQKAWWRKIYFLGLGEMLFRNQISASEPDFLEFFTENSKNQPIFPEKLPASSGSLVLIGGGKDSIVTLEKYPLNRHSDLCTIVNPSKTTLRCAELAGFSTQNIVEIRRTIDSNLLELNQSGFLNGHTPFNAMLAFLSYFIAYLTGKKFAIVSNESSANESNISGTEINHQYSKSFAFEQDFREYASQFLRANVEYLSFLRPLNELQIAEIFAGLTKYHSVFKSCNVGSKAESWQWCGSCAKCLFAFIILSPFLYKNALVEIFGQDLFAKHDLAPTLRQLTGHSETKPFDCVGTFSEVNFALSWTIANLKAKNQPLPDLLNFYETELRRVPLSPDLTTAWDDQNFLDESQKQALSSALASARAAHPIPENNSDIEARAAHPIPEHESDPTPGEASDAK